jgi:hypothetical protein
MKFYGNAYAPTQLPASRDTNVATTSYVNTKLVDLKYVRKNNNDGNIQINGNKSFVGSIKAPTIFSITGARLATTGNVNYMIENYSLKLTSDQTVAGTKTFTGSLLVPTKSLGDNSSAVASSAFVVTELDALYAKWVQTNIESESIGGDKTFSGEIIASQFEFLFSQVASNFHMFPTTTGVVSVGGGSLKTSNAVASLTATSVNYYSTHNNNITLGGTGILCTPNTVKNAEIDSAKEISLFQNQNKKNVRIIKFL